MKLNLILWISAIVIISGCSAIQNGNDEEAADEPVYLEFLSTSVDLGQVTKGDTATHTFYFVNRYDQPLNLRQINVFSDGLYFEMYAEQTPPNDTGIVYIELESWELEPGPFSADLDVYPARGEQVTLEVKAEVVE